MSVVFTANKLNVYKDGKENKQEGQCTYSVTLEALSRNHCCCEKAIIIRYSEFVCVALVVQHAVRRIMLSSVACLAMPYFFQIIS